MGFPPSASAAGTDRRRRCRCRCHQSSSSPAAADTAINVGACAASLHNSIGAIYHETLDFEGAISHYKESLQWFMPDDEPALSAADHVQGSHDPHDQKHQQHHHQADNQAAIGRLHHELGTLLRITRGYRALSQGGGATMSPAGDSVVDINGGASDIESLPLHVGQQFHPITDLLYLRDDGSGGYPSPLEDPCGCSSSSTSSHFPVDDEQASSKTCTCHHGPSHLSPLDSARTLSTRSISFESKVSDDSAKDFDTEHSPPVAVGPAVPQIDSTAAAAAVMYNMALAHYQTGAYENSLGLLLIVTENIVEVLLEQTSLDQEEEHPQHCADDDVQDPKKLYYVLLLESVRTIEDAINMDRPIMSVIVHPDGAAAA